MTDVSIFIFAVRTYNCTKRRTSLSLSSFLFVFNIPVGPWWRKSPLFREALLLQTDRKSSPSAKEAKEPFVMNLFKQWSMERLIDLKDLQECEFVSITLFVVFKSPSIAARHFFGNSLMPRTTHASGQSQRLNKYWQEDEYQQNKTIMARA